MVKDDEDPRKAWRDEMGKRLILELKRAKISQADLARRLNVTKQLSNHWCTGRSEMTAWQLLALDRLGLDTHYILTEKRAPTDGERVAAPAYMRNNALELLEIAQKLNAMASTFLRGAR
jgi:transcriptional regulator with XRE-family HTH domain